MFLLAAM